MNRGQQLASLRRRALMCSGGAVAFEGLLASFLGGAKPVRAERPSALSRNRSTRGHCLQQHREMVGQLCTTDRLTQQRE